METEEKKRKKETKKSKLYASEPQKFIAAILHLKTNSIIKSFVAYVMIIDHNKTTKLFFFTA